MVLHVYCGAVWGYTVTALGRVAQARFCTHLAVTFHSRMPFQNVTLLLFVYRYFFCGGR